MRKFWVILSVSLLLVLTISVSLYAKDLSAKELHKLKADQRYVNAYQDIIDSHSIKESDYIRVELPELVPFFKGQGEIKKQETLQRIRNVIRLKLWDYPPTGSLRPNFLISPDGNEVLLLYKEENGNNVVVKATWDENNEPVIEKMEKKGKPILPLEE